MAVPPGHQWARQETTKRKSNVAKKAVRNKPGKPENCSFTESQVHDWIRQTREALAEDDGLRARLLALELVIIEEGVDGATFDVLVGADRGEALEDVGLDSREDRERVATAWLASWRTRKGAPRCYEEE